ncbi:probable G-protein coupled receptor 179 [Oncorhynchus tshawytscha]|uniref:G-protein coupled receptors family 3 profile domain-containing protein n=1 Tax=Oncorhynchus tshawytscha TaxID=74940 RepID=A0AAZ3QAT4_ONCTS|nr:probable G-protein coupled receptor 179 [Oncorhynchus tshawytscha]XP_042158850.1 probable G-protein coupled receptor 179 [Oncorhynchus tshawytscha]XP_042158855.1 probable G-protein coupled receptor 179 [Oncorhynchus tshawytscha]
MAPPTRVDLRMGPVWLLLLLLTPLLSAQVSIVSELGTTAESEDPTASVVSTTGEPGTPYSPDPSGSVTIPSEAPKEDWTPAEVFLYSGDYSVLGIVECDRAYSLTGQNGPLPRGFYGSLRPSMDALANTANFLNMIFQASDLRESSVREDIEWYHAMVRALLEADPLIRQALLTFDADPASTTPQLVLRASRNPAPPRYQNILLQDLSSQWESLHLPAPAPDDTWFSSFKFPATSNQPTSTLSKRVLLNDLSTLDTPKWGRGDSYVTNRSGVRWANGPFLECEDGRFLPGWLLTLSTSFYGLKPDLSPEFRGVIRVDVNVQGLDVNQCDTGDAWFANTHQCNRTTMECQPITGQGFRLGQYCCRCREGYYSPPMDEGGALNGSGGEGGGVCYPALPICLPCWPGCKHCEDGTPCWVEEDWFLRAGVLAVQGFFMLLVFISMLVAYQFRRSRRIRASGLLLLETILFGSLLLYFPVFILYFKPSTFRCILLRWVRLLGFAIVYGTVTLKIYRVLKVFLSRTAQRVPYMSSIHLLRLLGVMVVTVSWFLCAWTAGVLQNRDRNVPLLIISTTSDGQGFSLCDLDRWDYMMAVAELMFLCWGSLLCSAVKPVPSAFHEPRYIGIAIHNELLLSSMFHLLRFVMPSLHPDWMLLLFFTHTHVTITVTLALLFIPKFLHVSRAGREEIAEEVYEDEVELRRSGSYLNSSFTSAVWSDHSLDPDDIRDELKKLYGQLEVHKTKKMTANNPHLQKKRSSRRGLGRSIIKRITEIPESMSRQCSRDGKEVNLGSRDVTHAESSKRAPDTFSVNYKDQSVKQPSPVLRKSQSDYDYVTDKDPSLHDSMLRATLAKRCSQRSETDSLYMAPLVCKSASAQNLTVDNNLLLPGPTKLHKSLSLASSKTHSLEDTSRVGRDTQGEQGQSQQDVTIKDQTSSALVQSQSYDKAEVCPWELAERPANKNQPHVTFAPSEEEPESPEGLSSPILKHICPWDHLPVPTPVESPAGDSQGGEAECESPRPQAPISASVPGSPKNMRVFSFRTSTQKWLSVKSFVGSVDASIKEKDKKETAGDTVKKLDSISQKSQGSVATIAVIAKLKLKTPSISSAEVKSQSVSNLEKKYNVSSIDKRTQQKRSMTTVDVKPALVKQAAIRLSSSDSSERSPRRIVVVQSTVYPWESEDMQKDSMYENVFISSKNTAHSTAKTPSTHRRGCQIRPALSVAQSDICPWDVPASSQQAPQRQQSIIADICPWEVEELEEDPKAPARVSVCPWESEEVLKRQESILGEVCPSEASVSAIPISSASNQSEKKSEGLNKKPTDVCPWETDETPQISQGLKPQESVRVDVCPWDVVDSFPEKVKVAIIYENVHPQENKGLHKAPPKCQETIHANVCPWESEETPKSQDGVQENVCPWESTDTPSIGKQDVQTKSTEQPKSAPEKLSVPIAKACPWEFPDPPKDLTVLCPWEKEESPMPPIAIKITKGSFSQETTVAKTNICPWDIGDQEETEGKDSPCTNVCPWETQGRTQADPKKTDSVQVNICPWETEKPEQQESTPAIVSIETGKTKRPDSALADVCPWETGATDEPDKTKRRDGTQTDIGPWETEDPKKTEEKDGVKVDVCPWETGETEKTNGQDSAKADISKETQKEKRRDSVRVNICPWDTDVPEEPETIKKQDGVRADVCPWETGPAEESEKTKSQDSIKAGICPWETGPAEESEKTQIQDSTKADICPWETGPAEESEKTKSQDSIKTDICPWETGPAEESENTKSQDSTKADICPWETGPAEESENTKSQDSTKADICPWETGPAEESEKTKSQDSTKADILPWETGPAEESEKTKSQDSIKADICPWETGPAEESEKTQIQDSTKADICPWETGPAEESENTKSQDSTKADICPWETGPAEESENTKSQDSTKADICPWGTGPAEESEKTKSQDSTKADILPWETGPAEESEKTKSQDSIKADICPWETGLAEKSEKTKSQDSTKADICPWETGPAEESENTKSQDSTKADICPWETGPAEESEKTKSQDSTKADILPWETGPAEESEKTKSQDSTKADICPWETGPAEESEKTKSQDSTKADICPWETGPAEESEKTKSQDSTKADICPWETVDPIEPEKIKKQSVREDVCSWETDEPEKSAEKEETMIASGIQDITETQGALSMEEGDAAEPVAGSTQTAEAAKANMPLARRDAMCPWEMEGTKSPSSPSSITEHDNNSDVFTWEPENILEEEEEEDDAESAAEAFVFPSDL